MKSFYLIIILTLCYGIIYSQGDPTPPKPQKKDPPPAIPSSTPSATPTYASSNTLDKYKTTRFGIYTFKTEVQDYPDYVDVKKSSFPAIYYSGGKSVNQYLSINFEAFLHYTSFEVEYDPTSSLESKSSVFNGGGGL